jgi:hypothetical protein
LSSIVSPGVIAEGMKDRRLVVAGKVLGAKGVLRIWQSPPGEDQSRFYTSRLPPYVLSCSRAESFVVARSPTCTQYLAARRGILIIWSRNVKQLMKRTSAITSRPQPSTPPIRVQIRRAHRKDGSKPIVVTRCFRLAPETPKGRGTTRSGTGYLPRG